MPGEAGALAALMLVDPSREMRALAGNMEHAADFQAALLEHSLAIDPDHVIVALLDNRIVGFAEVSTGGDVPPLPVVARAALHAFGVGDTLRAAWRNLARLKVDFRTPEGALHLVELQVHPECRNQGVGAALLGHVVERAQAQGRAVVSLTTAIDNPARRLYERSGFRVVEEKRNPRYERLTGSPGRVLLTVTVVPR
jgi:ribosomal protein S18 acetylase RimI-like enzyme